jgi:dynein heavy chain
MYQNSLTYVNKLFNNAIMSQMKVTQATDEQERQELLTNLVNEITLQLYEKICLGLFEQHKLVYAFIISTSILKD